MTDEDILQLWKTVARDDHRGAWSEDSVFAFFQRFRPTGAGVENALQPLVCGDEVLARLRRIYEATDGGRGDATDAYFIVRNPPRCRQEDLVRHARLQATRWREIAREQGDEDLVNWLSIDKIEVTDAERTMPDNDSPETAVYDAQTDWHVGLRSTCPHSHVLREAFYSIACDYYLAYWVTWPWYRDSTRIDEPYEPSFELWRHGAHMQIPSPHHVVLHVARSL